MIGTLPAQAPTDCKCQRCLVYGRMWHCWFCGEHDSLVRKDVDDFKLENSGWTFSLTNRGHIPYEDGPLVVKSRGDWSGPPVETGGPREDRRTSPT